MSDTHRHREQRKWHDRRPGRRLAGRVCQVKRYFADEIAARVGGMTSIEERGNVSRLWVYKCNDCSGWHLTKRNRGGRWEVVVPTNNQQKRAA